MFSIGSLNNYSDDINILVPAIEAVIFAAGEPISIEKIWEIFNAGFSPGINAGDKRKTRNGNNIAGLGADKKKKEMILAALEIIKNLFNEDPRQGIYLSVNNNSFSFKTKPEYYGVISESLKVKPQKFTKPQLETLSIIAYRQPIIKSELDMIRGVDSGGVIKFLLEKNLIRVSGRKDIIGRPLIYKTTNYFLEVFNLKNLNDLPSVKEIEDVIGKKGIENGSSKETESNEKQSEFLLDFK